MTPSEPPRQTKLEQAKAAARSLEAAVEKVVPGEIVRKARKVIILVMGGTTLLLGIALLVLPGPALLVIPLGLAILGMEFAWARRWMRKARKVMKDPKRALRNDESS